MIYLHNYLFEPMAVENRGAFSSSTLNVLSGVAELAITLEMRERQRIYSNAFLSQFSASIPCFCTTL